MKDPFSFIYFLECLVRISYRFLNVAFLPGHVYGRAESVMDTTGISCKRCFVSGVAGYLVQNVNGNVYRYQFQWTGSPSQRAAPESNRGSLFLRSQNCISQSLKTIDHPL